MKHNLPARVRLVDVGPRDGLQNEKATVATEIKVALIDRLADAGLPAIEATSFVSPKWVPQMADATDVMARIRRIGVGTPAATRSAIEAALAIYPVDEVSGHFHDTDGQALANVYASLELGIATFDASVAGLGGCPYAKGAIGNVATEHVIYLWHGLGIATGVDLDKLRAAGLFISDHLGRPTSSRVARSLAAKHPVTA